RIRCVLMSCQRAFDALVVGQLCHNLRVCNRFVCHNLKLQIVLKRLFEKSAKKCQKLSKTPKKSNDFNAKLVAGGLKPRKIASKPHHAQFHAISRATASVGDDSSRLPSARRFISTLPSARPRGPTRICQGMPIRSAVANFAPDRS